MSTYLLSSLQIPLTCYIHFGKKGGTSKKKEGAEPYRILLQPNYIGSYLASPLTNQISLSQLWAVKPLPKL